MYPSDISDKEWEILEPHVAQGAIGRPRKHNIRAIINAIRYIMRGGCQWRMLPKDFPPWKTVYDHYFRWRNNGKLQEIHDTLVKKVREMVGKNDTPSVGIIDSQSVKTTQKGDPEGLCCIATYERLTIVRIISNLLKILFFCNQSDQI